MARPRILIIRGGAIGDFILTLPAIRLLRENFPEAELEILGYKHIIALAKNRFYASRTRSIEYGPMAGFFVPNSELAPELVDYFASFHQVVSFLFDPDGFFAANLRRAGVRNFLPAFVRIDESGPAAALQWARPLEQMALYIENSHAQIFPHAQDRFQAAQFLGEAADRPLIAIHPGSGSLRKNWPAAHWIECGKIVRAAYPDSTWLLIGGEADSEILRVLAQVWPEARPTVNLPLPTLAAILEQSTMFIGHDSGISHLAAAVGTKCTLLFGPTNPEIWAPTNPQVTILRAPDGDLRRLLPEQLATAIF